MINNIITKKEYSKYNQTDIESEITKWLTQLDDIKNRMCYGSLGDPIVMYDFNNFIKCNLNLRRFLTNVEITLITFARYSNNKTLKSDMNIALLDIVMILQNLLKVHESFKPADIEKLEEKKEALYLLKNLINSNILKLNNIRKQSYA